MSLPHHEQMGGRVRRIRAVNFRYALLSRPCDSGMYHRRVLCHCWGMRRIAALALFCTVALSACSSVSGASSGPAFSGPDAMREKVTAALPLSECSDATRDVDGVLFVQCVDSTGGIVRLSTVDVGQEAAKSQGLTDMGWKVATGSGWIAAVNSDQETLGKVTSALG